MSEANNKVPGHPLKIFDFVSGSGSYIMLAAGKYIIRQRRISYRDSDISLKNATFYDIILMEEGVFMLENKSFNLSVLFVERPQKYGYRGDYYFWEYLQHYFYKHPELSEKKDIEETIKQQFRKMSNMELTTEAMPCVQEFAHGGMSSSYLSGDFWLNTAIPLLQKRFDER